MRKHGLDVVHAEYRRDSFHCEHALQSLVEIEGENTPGNLPSPPDQTPAPATTNAMGGTSEVAKQDSTVRREFDLKQTELKMTSDTVNAKTTQSDKPNEKEVVKSTQNTLIVSSAGKDVVKDVGKSQSISVDVSAMTCGPTTPDRTPVCQTVSAQELKPHSLRTEDPKPLEKNKDAGKTPTKTTTPEPSKSPKGSPNSELSINKNASKVSTPHVSDAGSASSKPTESKIQTPTRGLQEERCQETPASPSPTARSPCTSKSRAGSPGDRSSFVTQLTSVAKTVLGPMKLGSQDGGKSKDGGSKAGDDKRAATLGKSDGSSGGRRGLTGTWPGPGTSKTDKKSSSKHS